MSTEVVDRRILKAFYTQYVAVLLIILVFCVAGSRRLERFTPTHKTLSLPVNLTQSITNSRIGTRVLSNPFDSINPQILRESAELKAIAEALRSHDIRAKFEVGFTLHTTRSAAEKSLDLQSALQRVAVLKEFFKLEQVPTNAVGFLINDGIEAEKGGLFVAFESMETGRE